MKVALIFGITGQDGSYLGNFIKKKYKVTSQKKIFFLQIRIDHIYEDNKVKNFHLIYGDLLIVCFVQHN